MKKITGFNIENKEMMQILENLGFKVKKTKNFFDLIIPSWRPDISQEVDVVEELVRIKGYDRIKMIEPEKNRARDTLNSKQKTISFFTKIYSFKRISRGNNLVFYRQQN